MTLSNILTDALSSPDAELGVLLLSLYIKEEADNLSIPSGEIPLSFSKLVVTHVLTLEANSAKLTTVEKALHKAAIGEFETAGRLIREHIVDGAVIKKFLPIGIKKVEQAKDFGSLGAYTNREIGRNNRKKVLEAAKAILASRKRKPSGRELAGLVAEKTGIPVDTVRGHIKILRKDKLVD